MAEIEDTIKDALESPKRVSADGVSVDSHSIPDLIEAAKYLESRKAARRAGFLGIRLQKLKPPGATS